MTRNTYHLGSRYFCLLATWAAGFQQRLRPCLKADMQTSHMFGILVSNPTTLLLFTFLIGAMLLEPEDEKRRSREKGKKGARAGDRGRWWPCFKANIGMSHMTRILVSSPTTLLL